MKKDIKIQRYNSTYGFVSINHLENEAEQFFGKGWEAEDDVQQITDLLRHLGRADLIVSFIDGLGEDDILISENYYCNYRLYLFSQLFHVELNDVIKDIPYDLLFPIIVDELEKFLISEFNLDESMSEYDAMVLYLSANADVISIIISDHNNI